MWTPERWQLFALGSAVFAGITAVLGKVGVEGINSHYATFLRTVVVLLLAAVMVSSVGGWERPDALPRKSLVFLALSAAATGLSWLCYYRALQLGPASRVAPIDKLSIVFAVVPAVVFLGERLTWQTAVGATLVAAGAVIVALPGKG